MCFPRMICPVFVQQDIDVGFVWASMPNVYNNRLISSE